MNDVSDAKLVKAAQDGDESALEAIFKRYRKSLYFTAYKITNNAEDAQDALQDTFLQVSRSIHNVKRPEYLKLWMNRIIAGKCRDIFRKNKTVTIDMEDYKFQNQYAETYTEYIPEKNIRFETDKEVVNYYISLLPYPQREALILAYFQNFSMQEIADILNEPIGTIKSRIHLAKKTLKLDIQAYEQREHIKVNFRFSKLPTLLLTSAIASNKYSSLDHLRTYISSLTKTIGGKLAIATVVTIFAGGSIYAYQASQKQPRSLEQSSYIASPHVVFEEQKVESDHDAYFILMNWAMNAQQMEMKTPDEIEHYRPIYEYLKSRNSKYYQTLKQNGMDITLESYFL